MTIDISDNFGQPQGRVWFAMNHCDTRGCLEQARNELLRFVAARGGPR